VNMTSPLSSAAQRVQDALGKLGYHYAVVEFVDSTRTAQEAADRAGCKIGQIVKSMIFRGETTDKPILVLTSGSNRVDERLIGGLVGEPIRRAEAEFVRATTGFAIGGVPPIGHLQVLESFLDDDLMRFPTVWAAAGTPNAIFELKPHDLQKMTGALVARIKA